MAKSPSHKAPKTAKPHHLQLRMSDHRRALWGKLEVATGVYQKEKLLDYCVDVQLYEFEIIPNKPKLPVKD